MKRWHFKAILSGCTRHVKWCFTTLIWTMVFSSCPIVSSVEQYAWLKHRLWIGSPASLLSKASQIIFCCELNNFRRSWHPSKQHHEARNFGWIAISQWETILKCRLVYPRNPTRKSHCYQFMTVVEFPVFNFLKSWTNLDLHQLLTTTEGRKDWQQVS